MVTHARLRPLYDFFVLPTLVKSIARIPTIRHVINIKVSEVTNACVHARVDDIV